MNKKCILGVFAHPDDEAFAIGGSMRAANDVGIGTALICGTRGEAGEISDPALATAETLGSVREQELYAACAIMGVTDLTFLGYPDGQLDQVEEREAIGKIVQEIRRIRPQVVVTFDANGGYGHVDHMAIHRYTRQAFAQAGDPAAYPDQLLAGVTPYAPQKLYYSAFPRGLMTRLREGQDDLFGDFRPGGDAATIPVEQMGTPDEQISTAIVLDDRCYESKLRAWQAHRTQAGSGSFMDKLSPEARRAIQGTERFVRGYPAVEPGTALETDLFAGVQL